jgi:ribosomal protein S27E
MVGGSKVGGVIITFGTMGIDNHSPLRKISAMLSALVGLKKSRLCKPGTRQDAEQTTHGTVKLPSANFDAAECPNCQSRIAVFNETPSQLSCTCGVVLAVVRDYDVVKLKVLKRKPKF